MEKRELGITSVEGVPVACMSGGGALHTALIATEIDDVGAKEDVIFIGATDRPEMLDEALWRLGRLHQLICIPLTHLLARQAFDQIDNVGVKKKVIAASRTCPDKTHDMALVAGRFTS